MRTAATFLLKVLARQFYIANAGFLLFIFFVFFGMVNGGQLIAYHQSLISGMISSPVFMAVVWLAWLLYNIKCILFCATVIRAADSAYIFTLKAFPSFKQMMIYLLVSTVQYMPVLAYSFFVVYMAMDRGLLLTGVLVATYQCLMILFGAAAIFIAINKNRVAPVIEKIAGWLSIRKRISFGYYGFLPGHILYEKKIALALVKIFSILVLSVSFVRNGDHFDDDLLSIFFQVIFVAHSVLVFYCVDFSETRMQFSRNLPLSLPRIAGMYLFTYSLLLLPDAAFMLINNNGNLPVTEIFYMYATAVSVLFLYTAVLYGCGLNMESYMLFVFVIFVAVFFSGKTGLPLLTMLGIFFTAVVAFKTNYYTFERD